MNQTVIEIERVPLSFVADAAPDRAERVSRRVRDAVARTLPDALAAACGPDLDADDSYVFIDRIDVQCTVGGHWTDDAIARVFAERLAGALAKERQHGHALVFHDRAEYVSAFLAAAVDGATSSRWWFAEFEGLRHLPLSALIRTLVIAEGEPAWESLARLSPDVMRRAISALTVADADRLLDGIPDDGAATTPLLAELIEALELARAAPLASDAHLSLAALVLLVRIRRATPSSASRAAIRGLASLIAWVRDSQQRRHTLGIETFLYEWCQAVDVDEAVREAMMRLDSPALVEWVMAQVSERHADAASTARVASFDFTPFGGALLLAVVLVRSGSWQRWRDRLRERGREEGADLRAAHLALAVVARALAPTQAPQVERDPVLRRVFGVAADLGTFRGPSLGRSLRQHAQTLVEETARRIPGCDGSTPEYLRRQCLTFPAGVSADGNQARLGKAPLDVLLTLSGLTRATVTLPDGRPLSLRGEDL